MAIIILISAVAYFVFSSVLLIALLRSAARTSADWAAYMLLVNVQLTESTSDSGRACGHLAAGDAPPRGAADRQRPQVKHITPARPG